MKLATSMCLVWVLLAAVVFGQNEHEYAKKGKKVTVKNWKKVAYLFPENFWDRNAYLKNEIGEKEFENVKLYSQRMNIPCEMQLFCEDKSGVPKKNLDTLVSKLSKLVVYKIANIKNRTDSGKDFYYALLRVPYEENKNWDPAAKWDTVYFVIKEDLVEQSRYNVPTK